MYRYFADLGACSCSLCFCCWVSFLQLGCCGHTTVTSQVCRFPASQGTRERPSGRFPSDWLRPCGSLEIGITAETMAINSCNAWCLVSLPGAFLQIQHSQLPLTDPHDAEA